MEQVQRCPECGKEFPTPQALQEHINRDHLGTTTTEGDETRGASEVSTGPSQETCPACSGEFPSAESLQQHQQADHPVAASR